LPLRLGIAPQRGSYGRQPVSFEAARNWQLQAIATRSTVAGTTAWRSAAHRPVAAMSVWSLKSESSRTMTAFCGRRRRIGLAALVE
jgi:hypothetical protein